MAHPTGKGSVSFQGKRNNDTGICVAGCPKKNLFKELITICSGSQMAIMALEQA